MAKSTSIICICEPYCAFYRPGAKEELACGGVLKLESLVENNSLSIEILFRMKNERRPSARRNIALDGTVCNICPFLVDGCDFQSGKNLPDAEPCGGYKLLDLLMAKGLISLREQVT